MNEDHLTVNLGDRSYPINIGRGLEVPFKPGSASGGERGSCVAVLTHGSSTSLGLAARCVDAWDDSQTDGPPKVARVDYFSTLGDLDQPSMGEPSRCLACRLHQGLPAFSGYISGRFGWTNARARSAF